LENQIASQGTKINHDEKIIRYAPPVIHSLNIYVISRKMQQLVSLYFFIFLIFVFLLSRRKAIKRITTTKEIS